MPESIASADADKKSSAAIYALAGRGEDSAFMPPAQRRRHSGLVRTSIGDLVGLRGKRHAFVAETAVNVVEKEGVVAQLPVFRESGL